MNFDIGDAVLKTSGDYKVHGVVVARFLNHNNHPRYVVEIPADDGYFYHIFSEGQLEAAR